VGFFIYQIFFYFYIMGLVDYLLKGTIDKRVNQVAAQITANIVNQNLYRFIGDNTPLMNTDRFDYVGQGYESVGAVYECVSAILNKIIACPRIVYQIKDEQRYKVYKGLVASANPQDQATAKRMKAEVMVEVKVDKIENLLNNPNPQQNGDEFFELLAGMFLLHGNAFIYGNDGDGRSRKWTELWAMPQMHIISGGVMKPVKEYFLFWNTEQETKFVADNIKHIKTFNPNYDLTGSQLYGLSPLRAYVYSLATSREGDIRANKQLKNGTEFGIVSPKNKEDQWDKVQKTDFKERLVRGYESNNPLAQWFPSSIPLDFTRIGLSIADMELLKLKGVTAEDVYRAYKRPLAFLNQDASTYNNLRTANQMFIREAVAPVADRIAGALTDFICTPYRKTDGKVYRIELDYMSLPEMQADMKEMVEWLSKAWWIAGDDKRETMGWGRTGLPGMDVPLVPTSVAPVENIANGTAGNSTVQEVRVTE
jgi:HK97 family phage portal protein